MNLKNILLEFIHSNKIKVFSINTNTRFLIDLSLTLSLIVYYDAVENSKKDIFYI